MGGAAGRSVAKVMDPSRYCIAGSRSDQKFLLSAESSLMFPMEKMDACSWSMYVWWAAARRVSEQLLNAMWKVERVVSSTLVMAGRRQEIPARKQDGAGAPGKRMLDENGNGLRVS